MTEESSPGWDSWDYGANLADNQRSPLEAAVEAAFEKNKSKIGDNWSWEWAISEMKAEDFVRDVLRSLNIDV